jgi:hypothetical protein
MVETSSLPSGRMESASIFSLWAAKPTSLPSKKRLQVPEVSSPVEEKLNSRISLSSISPKPIIVSDFVSDIYTWFGLTIENASTPLEAIPTSDPSKNLVNPKPSNIKISSSLTLATLPTEELLVFDKDMYRFSGSGIGV